MFNNINKLLEKSLQLEEPWEITHAEFNEKEGAAHITVDVRKGAQFVCPECGGETKRYGYEPNERVWRHADICFFPCYIHCKRPRVLCPHCGVKQIEAPFERKNSRFTLQFESYAMLILTDMPIERAAKILRCDDKSLTSILRYWVNDALEKRQLDDVISLAIDETSFKKGHKYVTVVIDSAKRAVIDVEPGKDKSAVENFARKLCEKSGDNNNITSVTCDMSKAFTNAISERFPNADTTIDKFHVKQIVLNALDEVRKAEQKESQSKLGLFRGRRLFMIPEQKLTNEQAASIAALSKSYPQTGRAYRIVSAFDLFYDCESFDVAEKAFDKLYSWMRRCRLEPFKCTAKTLKDHKNSILNYFKNRFTNAICEGINSTIQAAKRKARGFHTFEGFSAMIYLAAGKLKLDCPKIFV